MTVSRYILDVGGQSEVLDPAEVARWLARAGINPDFAELANSIHCPIGQEPGSAWFLLSRAAGDALDANILHDLRWQHENGLTTWQNYVLMRAVLCGMDGDGKAPYICEFRDKRQVLRLSAIDKEYHVRRTSRDGDTGSTDLYYSDTRNAGSDWTWQTMFNDVWGNLPSAIRGTAPTLAYTPVREPENFQFHGSAWDAVGEILEATHSRLAYDPIADAFTVVRIGAEQTNLTSQLSALTRRKMLDRTPRTDLNLAIAPEKIRFYFPKRPETETLLAETTAGGMLVDPYHTIEKATSLTGAQAGTIQAYLTRFSAELDADGSTINNASALDTLADELLTKIKERYDRGTERGFTRYSGIVTTVLVGSEIHSVTWRDHGDSLGCVTELRRDAELGMARGAPEVRPGQFNGIYRGVTDGAITKGSSGTVSRYTPGTTTDSGTNDTVFNDFANVGSGKKVAYAMDGANLYMIAAEC